MSPVCLCSLASPAGSVQAGWGWAGPVRAQRGWLFIAGALCLSSGLLAAQARSPWQGQRSRSLRVNPTCLSSALRLWPQQTGAGSLSAGRGRSRASREGSQSPEPTERTERQSGDQRPCLLPSPEPSEAGAAGRLLLTRPPHHSFRARLGIMGRGQAKTPEKATPPLRPSVAPLASDAELSP